jgi:uncharacterized membrane protein
LIKGGVILPGRLAPYRSGVMIHVINILLITAHLVFSFAVWKHLPDLIPMHYGLTGLPDSWVVKTQLNWFMIPMINFFTILLLYACSFLKINPNRWNIFKKGEFLKYSKEDRQAFKEEAEKLIKNMCYKMAVVMNVLFFYIQVVNYMVATERWRTLPLFSMIFIMVVVYFIIIRFIIKFTKLKKGILKTKEEGVISI